MPPRVLPAASPPGPTPRTTFGLSGLGAVGGPRGVGAGAARVILEFITQYDRKAVAQLEKDLAKLAGADSRAAKAVADQNRVLANSQAIRTRLENIRAKFTAAELRDIKRINDLRKQGDRASRIQANQLVQSLRTGVAGRGVSPSDLTFLINGEKNLLAALHRREAAQRRLQRIEGRLQNIATQRVQTEAQITKLVQLRTLLLPKLGALAIGAVGGIFGGAVVGIGFAAAQGLIEAIGQALKDVVDPANRARDALEGVAETVTKLADEKNISLLEAARQILTEMGPAAAGITAESLVQSVALQAVKENFEALNKAMEVSEHQEELTTDAIKAAANALGDKGAALKELYRAGFDQANINSRVAGAEDLLARSIDEVERQLREETAAAEANARAKDRLAQASAYAAVQERNLAAAIQAAADMAISGIQDQIDALDASASAASRQAEIDALNFERRLLQGGSTDPNKVTGQLRIMALEAKIAQLSRGGGAPDRSAVDAIQARIDALEKLGDEQERYNRLLDIQFKKSQTIRRQEGETIEDFLERRAQEQRHLLEEEDELKREAVIATLEAEKEKLEAQLDRYSGGNQAAIAALQKEKRLEEIRLRLAQINEEKIQEERRRSLQEQLDKTREFWRQVAVYGDKARVEELKQAIRFTTSMQQLFTLSGEVVGVKMAASQLRALLQAGLVSPVQRDSILAFLRIADSLTATYNRQIGNLLNIRVSGGGSSATGGFEEGFQHGGVFPLTNASTVFGQNIRTGEGGTELGMVLSNKVTQALRETSGGPLVGEINFQSSGDNRRDEYRLRQVVREELARSVR